MIYFENLTNDIMRLKVPFEDIYTSVFVIKVQGGYILVDAATDQKDAEEIILPALEAANIPFDEIRYIFCTHLHGDHGGGIRHLLPHLKNAKVAAISNRAVELYGADKVLLVKDGENYWGIEVVHLPGHSADSLALYDSRTKTILTGDSIQLYGITRYGCGVGLIEKYKESIARLGKKDIALLVASHEYYPLGSMAYGKKVKEYLAAALTAFARIENFVVASERDDAVKIATDFTAEARKSEPGMPSLQSSTVKAIIRANSARIGNEKILIKKEEFISNENRERKFSTVLGIIMFAIVIIPTFLSGIWFISVIVAIYGIVQLSINLGTHVALKNDNFIVSVEACTKKDIYSDSETNAETYYIYFGKERIVVDAKEYNAAGIGSRFYTVRARKWNGKYRLIAGYSCQHYELDDSLRAKMIS